MIKDEAGNLGYMTFSARKEENFPTRSFCEPTVQKLAIFYVCFK